MNCQNPKCKAKSKIQTVRTYNEGAMTRRQKRCSKCRYTFYTLEMTEQLHEDLKRSLSDAQREAIMSTSRADNRIEEITSHIKALFDLSKTDKKPQKR